MLSQIKAVIFDLDGTLVDSMGLWKDIDIEFLGERGITYEDDLQEKIEGMSFTETAVYFKEYYHLDESVEELKKIWNQMAEYKYRYEVLPKPGVIEFLDTLKKKKIKMGIATQKGYNDRVERRNSESRGGVRQECVHKDT